MENDKLTPHQLKILQTIWDFSENIETPYGTVQGVATKMNKPESSIRTSISDLKKRGYLEHFIRGAYILSAFGIKTVSKEKIK